MAQRDTSPGAVPGGIVSITWTRTSQALRRVTQRAMPVGPARRRQNQAADDQELRRLRRLYPAEVAALLDLGLSEGAVAAYLLHAHDVERPRSASASPGASAVAAQRPDVLYRALDSVSAASLRKLARRRMAEARRSADEECRTTLAEHAFALAAAAEALERRSADAALANETAGAPSLGNDGLRADGSHPETPQAEGPSSELRERARLWRLKAEEYRTIADALDTGAPRESYLHLARAYAILAEQSEARATLRAKA